MALTRKNKRSGLRKSLMRKRSMKKRSTRKATRRSRRRRTVKTGGEKHPETRAMLTPSGDANYHNYYNVDFYPIYHEFKNQKTHRNINFGTALNDEAVRLNTKYGLIGKTPRIFPKKDDLINHLSLGYDEYKDKYQWLNANPGKTLKDYKELYPEEEEKEEEEEGFQSYEDEEGATHI